MKTTKVKKVKHVAKKQKMKKPAVEAAPKA
jgi:hypothetical protein